jgi:hypothetical protein
MPGYGRLEIEGADKPKPAPSFHQSWTSESKPQLPEIPANPPPVIMAPQFNQNSIEQNFSGPERRDPRGPQRRP